MAAFSQMMGSHHNPNTMIKGLTGKAPIQPGEDPMDEYLRDPLNASWGAARGIKSARGRPAPRGGGLITFSETVPQSWQSAIDENRQTVSPITLARNRPIRLVGRRGIPSPTPAFRPLANGGNLKPNAAKPYLVGEEGPELVLPREDGSFHVVPADATQKVMSTLEQAVIPRRDGGPMGDEVYSLETPQATFAGFASPFGSGFATQVPEEQDGNAALTGSDTPRWMADPSRPYQVDPSQPGMPVKPDVVKGGWGMPGLPVTPQMQEELDQRTRDRAALLPSMGAMTAEQRADAELVPDGRVSTSGRDRLLSAQGSLEPPQMIPLAEMKNRITERMSLNFQRRGEEREASERAARDQRNATLGFVGGGDASGPVRRSSGATPSGRSSMDPDRIAERMARNGDPRMLMQREAAKSEVQEVGWQTMVDPNTGRPFAFVNNRGQTISLPRMEDDEELTFVDTQKPDPLGIGIITVREPRIYNRKTGKMREVPMDDGTVQQALPPGKPAATPAATPPAPSPAAPATSAKTFVDRFKKRN